MTERRRPAVLVVVLDVDFRAAAFEQLRSGGYQVDAVADLHSGRRRLDRDEYPLVIFETALGELPVGEDQILVSVDPAVDEGDHLLERVDQLLGFEPDGE